MGPKGVPRPKYRGDPWLRDAVAEARPLLHCFGHNHLGYGATLVDWKAKIGPEEVDGPKGREKNSDGELLYHQAEKSRCQLWSVDDLDPDREGRTEDQRRAVEEQVNVLKVARVYQTRHCAGDAYPVAKGRQTLFVNAAHAAPPGQTSQKYPVLVAVDLTRDTSGRPPGLVSPTPARTGRYIPPSGRLPNGGGGRGNGSGSWRWRESGGKKTRAAPVPEEQHLRDDRRIARTRGMVTRRNHEPPRSGGPDHTPSDATELVSGDNGEITSSSDGRTKSTSVVAPQTSDDDIHGSTSRRGRPTQTIAPATPARGNRDGSNRDGAPGDGGAGRVEDAQLLNPTSTSPADLTAGATPTTVYRPPALRSRQASQQAEVDDDVATTATTSARRMWALQRNAETVTGKTETTQETKRGRSAGRRYYPKRGGGRDMSVWRR